MTPLASGTVERSYDFVNISVTITSHGLTSYVGTYIASSTGTQILPDFCGRVDTFHVETVESDS
jgi:hypothetical protein